MCTSNCKTTYTRSSFLSPPSFLPSPTSLSTIVSLFPPFSLLPPSFLLLPPIPPKGDRYRRMTTVWREKAMNRWRGFSYKLQNTQNAQRASKLWSWMLLGHFALHLLQGKAQQLQGSNSKNDSMPFMQGVVYEHCETVPQTLWKRHCPKCTQWQTAANNMHGLYGKLGFGRLIHGLCAVTIKL